MPYNPDNVLFLPGFGGSQLSYRANVLRTGTVWLSPLGLIAGGFRRMRLPVQGEPSPPSAGYDFVPGSALPHYYGLLLGYLRLKNWYVASPPADWRKPQAEDAERAYALFRTLSSSSTLNPVKCHVVCHSRGGLLARRIVARLAASGELSRLGTVVTLGTPHRGSVVAALALAGRYGIVRSMHELALYAGSVGVDDLPWGDAQALVRSWPSVYELLPDPSRPFYDQSAPALLYDPETYAASDPRPVAAYLAAAVANWSALPDPPPGVSWVDVTGYGLDTPSAVTDPLGLADRSGVSWSPAGDGVVVPASGHVAGRRWVASPCSHDLLPQDGRVWPLIDAALRGALSEDVTIRGSLLAIPI